MQRYFAKVDGKKALLSEEDKHHLLNVMRAKEGDVFEVADGGDVYRVSLLSREPFEASVCENITKKCELPCNLLLAFALLKHGNDDWILEKGTELGVVGFFPFVSSRTIVRPNGSSDEAKKRDRSIRIVKGACEQSKRNRLPDVHPILSFEKILEVPADLKLFAYENKSDDVTSLSHELASLREGQSCLLIIGPEGGFSPSEAELALAKGFRYVSLGRRILRAETAALYAASVFGYAVEEK
jgi:16S rRNA (uracil1498-N3)-methyltransferase